MKYLIFVAIAVLIVFVFWRLNRSNLSKNGLQKFFIFNTHEKVTEEWQIYIAPQGKGLNNVQTFFETGGVFTLLKTDQARLILRNGNQAFVFDKDNWPLFEDTSKKPSLHLFTRVSDARVLMVRVPNEDFEMQWHVPRELRIVHK